MSAAPEPDLHRAEALVVARLILSRQFVDHSPVGIRRVCRIAGTTVDEVRAAVISLRSQEKPRGTNPDMADWHAHRRIEVDPIGPDRIPTGRGGRGTSKVHRVREDGTIERRCCRCTEWLPLVRFPIKHQRTQARGSMCLDCRARYQRTRYLMLKRSEEIAGYAGLTFSWTDADPVIACAGCGQPFVAGDTVHGDAHLRHATCPTGGRVSP